MARRSRTYTSVEVCAGAGGQAVGHRRQRDSSIWRSSKSTRTPARHCAATALNGTSCSGICITSVPGAPWPRGRGPARRAVPCPPFSAAGRQLGRDDERDLFPVVLDLAETIRPRVLMIENVRGLLQAKFDAYRGEVTARLERMGYRWDWRLLQARDYGVAQLRPRSVLIAAGPEIFGRFAWPRPHPGDTPTVGEVLRESMSARGWEGAHEWAAAADRIAPTLVGDRRSTWRRPWADPRQAGGRRWAWTPWAWPMRFRAPASPACRDSPWPRLPCCRVSRPGGRSPPLVVRMPAGPGTRARPGRRGDEHLVRPLPGRAAAARTVATCPRSTRSSSGPGVKCAWRTSRPSPPPGSLPRPAGWPSRSVGQHG